MKLTEQFVKAAPEPGTICVWWLGQSGYCLKAADGTTILIDPYLTDTIRSGYKPYIHARMIPPVLEIEDLEKVDAVLYSHDHMDHMDPDTLVRLAWHTDAVIAASAPVLDSALKCTLAGIEEGRLKKLAEGETWELGDFSITTIVANHSAGSVGFLVKTGELCLYFCGDTYLFYNMKKLGESCRIDAAFLCFNGQGGNMDVSSAVEAARVLHPACVVPAHYGMYADNNADPDNLEVLLAKKAPGIRFRKLQIGEGEVFCKE